MPLFFNPRDVNLFNGMNKQFIDNIVDTSVIILKLDAYNTRQNVYGESKQKQYLTGLRITALVVHQTPTLDTLLFGSNYQRPLQVKFNTVMLKAANIYPEIGDIIQYDGGDFQISSVIQNQFIGGQVVNNFSVVCNCVYTSKSKTQTQQTNKSLPQQRQGSIYK